MPLMIFGWRSTELVELVRAIAAVVVKLLPWEKGLAEWPGYDADEFTQLVEHTDSTLCVTESAAGGRFCDAQ